MLASLGTRQGSLIGLGSTGGKQCRAIIELHLFHRAVGVVCRGSYSDIREDILSGWSEADEFGSCLRCRDTDVGRSLVQ